MDNITLEDVYADAFAGGQPELGLYAFNGNFNGNFNSGRTDCYQNSCSTSPVPLPSSGVLLGFVLIAVVCSRLMRGRVVS